MILLGIGLHALGGIAAASCYISQKGASKWSWQTYWLVFCLVAWFIMPLGISAFTVPDLGAVLLESAGGFPPNEFFAGDRDTHHMAPGACAPTVPLHFRP